MDLSIVIPIKDERENLRRLHDRVVVAMQPTALSFELILVDDGSTDGSADELKSLAILDARVKVVQLRRNFGQSAAMQAGIDHAVGDIIVTMDGDLQNDPSDIPMLLDTLHRHEVEAVFGQRVHRQDGFVLRTLPSQLGNWLIRKVTGVDVLDMGCTLRAMRHDLAKSLALYGEMHRFIPVLVRDAGATYTQVPVQHHARVAGRTKYTLSRTFRVVLDLITIKFMQGYITRPMHVMGFPGLMSMALGMITLFVAVIMRFFDGAHLTRNPLLHLAVMFELVGVQLIATGLLGELVTRTYHESQGKRAYTVRSTLNLTPTAENLRRAA